MTSEELERYPKTFPEQAGNILLQGPVGDLEALIDHPEPDIARNITGIVCHNSAENGGSLHGKVVQIIERSLRELGLKTIRFNFRGVGLSQGCFDHGYGETDDLIAVSKWLRKVCPQDKIWFGGYGFGSYVSAKACQKIPVQQLVSVAPVVEQYDFTALPMPECPWLIIQGNEDEAVSTDAVYHWVESLEPAPQLIQLDEADHTFHRRLMDLRGVIKNGIKRQQQEQL